MFIETTGPFYYAAQSEIDFALRREGLWDAFDLYKYFAANAASKSGVMILALRPLPLSLP